MTYRILILFLCLSPLHAEFLKYGFDGDFEEHFEAGTLSDNSIAFQQVAGRLIYHNDGVLSEDTTTLFELKEFKPTVSQSWTFSVEVTIPNRLKQAELVGDAELFLGIGCFSTKDEKLRYFTHTFNMGTDGVKDLRSETGFADNEPFRDQGRLQVLNGTITLRIRYEGGIFTLFRTNQDTGSDTLFSLDIRDGGFSSSENLLDWELEPDDPLTLFIVTNTQNYPVLPEHPLQMDNLYFILHGTDTEEGSITRNEDLLNVEVKAFPTGFSELQKSHDLENWITIKTLRKGLRENMLLPSDNGKAHYRVIKP